MRAVGLGGFHRFHSFRCFRMARLGDRAARKPWVLGVSVGRASGEQYGE